MRAEAMGPNDAFRSLDGEVETLTAWLAHQAGGLTTVVETCSRATARFGSDLSHNSHQLAPLYLARALTALGRLDEAEQALVPLRSHAFALAAISEGTRAEVEAELAWATGRIHESRSWAARRARWAAPSPGAVVGHRPPLAQSLVLAEAGGAAAATALEEVVRQTSVAPLASVTDEVLARVALATVCIGAGHYGRARMLAGDPLRAERVLSAWANLDASRQRSEQDLLRAADVAAAHGTRTALVGAPPALLELTHRAATHHVHDHLATLVGVAVATRSPVATPGPLPDRGGPALSRGELQLVAHLPTRMTTADMAAELGVSLNTVKTPLRRLFAKLGVHDRRHAVERASESGLLPAGRQDLPAPRP